MYGFRKTIAVVDINTFRDDSNAKFKCFQEELLIQIQIPPVITVCVWQLYVSVAITSFILS